MVKRPPVFKAVKKKDKARTERTSKALDKALLREHRGRGGEEIECSTRTTARAFSIASESDPTKKYSVRYNKVSSGLFEWACNCPACIYKKIGVQDCKHLRKVMDRVCRWKSTAGPERQTKTQAESAECPRCGKPTQVMQKENEDV